MVVGPLVIASKTKPTSLFFHHLPVGEVKFGTVGRRAVVSGIYVWLGWVSDMIVGGFLICRRGIK